jgi:hypothetical protein
MEKELEIQLQNSKFLLLYKNNKIILFLFSNIFFLVVEVIDNEDTKK